MKLTLKKLQSLGPCEEGLAWYKSKREADLDKICALLLNENKVNWVNWLLVRLMTKKQNVQYSVYAVEKVIDIFDQKYPNDKGPRKAIEAGKNYIKSPTAANKSAAAHAADAADAAARAANAKQIGKEIVAYGLKLLSRRG